MNTDIEVIDVTKKSNNFFDLVIGHIEDIVINDEFQVSYCILL